MIDYERLKAFPIPEGRQTYSGRDTILYALGIGFGLDDDAESDVPFVYERNLRAFPSMALVLGYPGFWLRDPATGVDWKRILHGEQGLTLHRPLPSSGAVTGKSRVVEIFDKGPGRDALLLSARDIVEDATGDLLATATSTVVIRGAGGFGGPASPKATLPPLPEREPDRTVALPTSRQAAMIYRLSGDLNPLHVDPEVAEAAGFERPILHGLCTFAVALRGLRLAGTLPELGLRVFARFSAPVYPGETIATDIWDTDTGVMFRARSVERGTVVLTNGTVSASL